MNTYTKLLLGAVTAITLANVACAKSKGNGGDSGNTVGAFGCVQVGAQCVPAPQGYVGKGIWDGDIGNDDIGGMRIKITLRPNSPGGYGGGYGGNYGGGYGGGGFYGPQVNPGVNTQVVQTMASVEIRGRGMNIRQDAIATGTPSNFTVQLQGYYGPITILGTFTSPRQTQLNISVTGAISAGGPIFRKDNGQISWRPGQNIIIDGYERSSGGYGFGLGY